ncbi:Glutaredoxin-related protein [Handroanthus impetiginosus]|uniref:Glutaredoxin-related protein n=1 Tax=Handroanthus impetiginosus TaxID=429701 RepID=A0A2G9HPP6_9LAMI|nr:Glutaredoxin-related protein [Handroanthus impetiginosus]
MGCVSSKLIEKEIQQENRHKNGECINHVVSLTSSTYGLLKLDKEIENQLQKPEVEVKKSVKDCVMEVRKTSPSREEPSEIINAWELMEGLEEDNVSIVVQSKRSPKSRPFLRFSDMDVRSPLKFLNQMGSPRKVKKGGGKENKGRVNGGIGSLENSPKTVLKEFNSLKKPSPRLWASIKGSPNVKRCNSLRIDSGTVLPRRRSLGPLFDPELGASLEKEASEEEEEIKKIVSVSVSSTPASRKKKNTSEEANAILDLYQKVCPPGGENAVVIYTTTLRGIRKTFEDCNLARSIIESQNVQMFERDISMDSGFKEELRGLMGSKEVKVPLVFVKGRLIGGADEMGKLDEEDKLEILFDGIPKAGAGCLRCAGVRFVMCMFCNGSCKVLGEDGKKSVKCSKCNENGLIQCPICC